MAASSRRRSTFFALVLLGVIAAGVFAADQLVKNAMLATLEVGESMPVLGTFLQFTLVKNPGAAFSLASGSTWIFSIIALTVVVVIVVFARRIRSLAWAVLFGMLLGGTLGNLFDRLFREPGFGVGHVVDYIHFSFFNAIFNIADIFIVSSAGLYILLTILGLQLDGTRRSAAEEAEAAVAAQQAEADAADRADDADADVVDAEDRTPLDADPAAGPVADDQSPSDGSATRS